MLQRKCSRCPNPASENHAWCKPCQAAYYQEKIHNTPGLRAHLANRAKEFRTANPERMKEHYRRHNLKNSCGATVEWYEAKFKEQSGVCAICGAEPKAVRNGGIPRLHSDHSHKTGLLRGLLCANCNFALTRLEDIPDWHKRALAYLALWE
jgi:hypothetical protein